ILLREFLLGFQCGIPKCLGTGLSFRILVLGFHLFVIVNPPIWVQTGTKLGRGRRGLQSTYGRVLLSVRTNYSSGLFNVVVFPSRSTRMSILAPEGFTENLPPFLWKVSAAGPTY